MSFARDHLSCVSGRRREAPGMKGGHAGAIELRAQELTRVLNSVMNATHSVNNYYKLTYASSIIVRTGSKRKGSSH